MQPVGDDAVAFRASDASALASAEQATDGQVTAVEPAAIETVAAINRGEVAASVAEYRAAADERRAQIEEAKAGIAPALQAAEQAALSRLRSAAETRREAVRQAAAAARARVESDAEGARGEINAAHDEAVAAIREASAAAREAVSAAQAAERAEVTALQTAAAAAVGTAFTAAVADARAAGRTAGADAVSRASARADAYAAQPLPETSGWDDFWDGADYEANKRRARVQAANDVGNAYRDEFATKAEECAAALPQGQSQVSEGFGQRAEQATGAIDQIGAGALQQIAASEERNIAAAAQLRDAQLAAVDAAVTTAQGAIDAAETSHLGQIDESIEAQAEGISSASATLIGNIETAIDASLEQFDATVEQTASQAESVEFPDAANVEQSLSESLTRLDALVAQAQQARSQGETDFTGQLDTLVGDVETSLDAIVTAAQGAIDAALESLASALSGARDAARDGLSGISGDHATSVNGMGTDAAADMGAAREAAGNDFDTVLTNLGQMLAESVAQLNADFQASLSGIESEISSKAEEAAGKVQPAWKSWVALILTIIITIIVTAAIVALAASGVGLLATIGLAALIGAAGGVAKMAVDKWSKGEEITLADVGQAALIGAVEGLITLAGAGAGSAVTGAIGRRLAEETAKKFVVRAGLFMLDSAIGTTFDSIGAGLIDTTRRLVTGQEVSWGTFWDATAGSVLVNAIGNVGGNALAPFFGKALTRLGIGRAASESTQAVTREVTEEAVESTTAATTREVTEEVVETTTAATTREATEEAVETTTSATTREAVEETTEEVVEDTTAATTRETVEETTEEAVEDTTAATTRETVEETTEETTEATTREVTEEATGDAARRPGETRGAFEARTRGYPDPPEGHHWRSKSDGTPYLARNPGTNRPPMRYDADAGEFVPRQLNNVDTRIWYKERLAEIPDRLDPNLPLRERAMQAHELRNEIKLQARDLMADRAAAAALPPPRTLDDVIARARAKGLEGDDIWHYVLAGSGKSDPKVNAALGL
ncbi:MAG: hypothetical protein H6701_14670 [Myxococcales bacterium]|nr:hypothetical protein [Myxococcales bacterium]